MKTKTSLAIGMLILLTLSTTGCSTPQYGNAKQYDEENWHFLASPGQVARMRAEKLLLKENELALKKLESLPVKGDAIDGYEGIVANYSSCNRYTFVISGPERKAYVLGPKESTTDKLLPGTYVVKTIYSGGRVGNDTIFHVGPQLNYFQGDQYHWFVYNE